MLRLRPEETTAIEAKHGARWSSVVETQRREAGHMPADNSAGGEPTPSGDGPVQECTGICSGAQPLSRPYWQPLDMRNRCGLPQRGQYKC